MSKRCELQKKYYKEFGNYKGDGKYSDDYVKWLENEVLALRYGLKMAHNVKNKSSMREKIINILQDTDWSDNGIENMADKILLLLNVGGQSEQLCGDLHSTDWNGKCFKCGKQVFVREPK